MTRREATKDSPARCFNGWDWPGLAGHCASTATVADNPRGRWSESRNGENPISDSTRGPKEDGYGERYFFAYSHRTEVLLYYHDVFWPRNI